MHAHVRNYCYILGVGAVQYAVLLDATSLSLLFWYSAVLTAGQ